MRDRRAVFLDRDGTLVEDPGYLASPDRLRLLPGAARAVARFNAAGWATVVVTNQSGIARGLYTEAEYRATAARLEALLAERRARLDGQYHCPHHPDFTGACECRKPGTLLYRRAAEELGLDLAASWWIGDRLRDVEAARTFGGRGVLVRTGAAESPLADVAGFLAAPDLDAAATLVLERGPSG